MSAVKPKFRSRKLDFKRSLPILHAKDIPHFDDDLNRSVPVVATGVEKEEEEEHHLQAVMSAQASSSATTAAIYIPTPDASRIIDYYEEQYNTTFQMPKSLIRFSNVVEDTLGPAVYCMDESDTQWLREFNALRDSKSRINELQFEMLFSELESLAARHESSEIFTPNLEHLRAFVLLHHIPCQPPDVVRIQDYWLRRRKEGSGRPVMPALKPDQGQKSEYDPFVCFRRREIRNTRKTRRTDVQSLQRLRQLRSEMESARVLVEMVAKREKMRREMLLLEHVIFEQRSLIQELKERLNLPEDVLESARTMHRKRNVKTKAPSPMRSVTKRRRQSEADEEVKLDPLSLEIQAAVAKRRTEEADWMDATEMQIADSHPACNYDRWEIPISSKGYTLDRGRYRRGRGGRMIVDRPSHFNGQVDGTDSNERWRYDDMEGSALSTDSNASLWYKVYGLCIRQASNLMFRLGLMKEVDEAVLSTQPYVLPPLPTTTGLNSSSIFSASSSSLAAATTPKPHRSPQSAPKSSRRKKADRSLTPDGPPAESAAPT